MQNPDAFLRRLFDRAVEVADRLADRHRQRAGREDLLDRAAGDHRLHVVELVDLDAREDAQLMGLRNQKHISTK